MSLPDSSELTCVSALFRWAVLGLWISISGFESLGGSQIKHLPYQLSETVVTGNF